MPKAKASKLFYIDVCVLSKSQKRHNKSKEVRRDTTIKYPCNNEYNIPILNLAREKAMNM